MLNKRNLETCDNIVAVSSSFWKPRRLVSGFLALSVLLFCLCSTALSASLNKMSIRETKEKLRLVLELSEPVKYRINKGNAYAVVTINGLEWKESIPRSVPSEILDSLMIEDKNGTCEVIANYKYLTSCGVFTLKDPSRLVIDFKKLSKLPIPKINIPEIQKIETRSLADRFKIVVELSSIVPYVVNPATGGIIVELPNTNSIIKSKKIVTRDKLIPRVGVDQVGQSTLISIKQNYPSFYQIYKLENPARLVIEFDRASKSTLIARDIAAGLRYVKLLKGTEEGPVTVNSLIVEQKLLSVFPYITEKKEEPVDIIGILGSFFTFFTKEELPKPRRDKVSSMVRDAGAMAGINGTFFGRAGEPLGILMIDGELISYSINDRTALIIDRNNNCYIDNISLVGEVTVEGVIVQLSGINSRRQAGEAVLYTPRYGSQTDEDDPGIVLTVIGNEVQGINRVRGSIPRNGYALSLDPSYYDLLGKKVKTGSKIHASMKLMPLSGLANLELKHVIGGGPRLLKSGQVYISRNSERFKSDIAKSRAARTAVGINSEGNLVFATVDKCLPAGRADQQGASHDKSVGATLEELAQIMKDLGCVDAMNMDGGSSSTMVISSEVINSPSGGAEKPVSNAILIGK